MHIYTLTPIEDSSISAKSVSAAVKPPCNSDVQAEPFSDCFIVSFNVVWPRCRIANFSVTIQDEVHIHVWSLSPYPGFCIR